MLGSRASFKLQGLAVDFDNRLWSKDARQWILTYPDLWLLVAGHCQARHYHPHRHHRCYHHDHQHPAWPVAGGGREGRPSSIFLALLSRCLWPVLDTRSLSTAETLGTSRANGRRQSASATLRWRSTQPVTRTCSAPTVNRTQGDQRLRLCPHSLCSSSSSSRELFEECPHPKGSIGVQSC